MRRCAPIGTAMWIKVGMTSLMHASSSGLPDVDEIREIGEAAHFCNKEKEILIRLPAWWPTSLRVFNMSINPVKSQYTHATGNLGRMF